MRDQTPLGRSIVMALATMLVVLSAAPVLATSPGPVIPVGGLDLPEAPAQDEPKAEDSGCLVGGGGVASISAGASAAAPLLLTSYPGPVIPVGSIGPSLPTQNESPCQTSLSLSLEVKSRTDRDPEGADASLEELLIPRNTLRSGFEATMAAGDRTITLSHPGDEWDIKSVDCSCGGGGSAGVAATGISISGGLPVGVQASYPRPVIPVGVIGGGGTQCAASGATRSAMALAAGRISGAATMGGRLSTYPGPVIPVGVLEQPTKPAEPTRQPGSVSWTKDGTVRFDDPEEAGAILSCKWTVEHVYGHVDIRTKTTPAGREGRFAYDLIPDSTEQGQRPQRLQGSASGSQAKVREGGWTVKMREANKAWKLQSSSCRETDTETTSSAQGKTADLGVDPGDRVTCTFKLKLRAPLPGTWRTQEGPMKVTCDGLTISVPSTTDSGRLRVRDDGDTVLGGGGGVKWTMRRDSADPLRYTGEYVVREGGGRADFETDLKMVNEKKLVGTLKGTGKIKGHTCKFKRTLKMTHIGGG
jgi:hypothetical protein